MTKYDIARVMCRKFREEQAKMSSPWSTHNDWSVYHETCDITIDFIPIAEAVILAQRKPEG